MSLLNLFREERVEHIVIPPVIEVPKCCVCNQDITGSYMAINGVYTCSKCDELFSAINTSIFNFGGISKKLHNKARALHDVVDFIQNQEFVRLRGEILEEWYKYKKKKEELELKKNLKLLGLRK